MSKKILVLGAGTGGTVMANRLRKHYSTDDASITVVDQDNRHVYQPGLLFLPFGLYSAEEIVRTRSKQLSRGVNYVQTEIDHVSIDDDRVHLVDGSVLAYDILIVASGTVTRPQDTPGMLGDGWEKSVFDFYTMDGAQALADKLETFEGGRLVVNVVDMPIKCPVAPIEFVFLADWFFHQRGMRDKVELVFATPGPSAFAKPTVSEAVTKLLGEKNIELVTSFKTNEVDSAAGKLKGSGDREQSFDLLVTVPSHGGAEYIKRSPGLGNERGFVPTDKHTLQTKARENIFALGDTTNLPTSKAGSVTHFAAEVLTENIVRFLDGESLKSDFDGHANCFIETGFKKAMLIDFNYETDPAPGTFPFAGVGPMKLLGESYMNHMGKIMFQWLYWHMLLPGRDFPFVPSQMTTAGKQLPEGEDFSAPATS